jgi:class 3 adenylate cyclase/tetratricopeptide (TPR) repeat protein
VSNSQSQPTIDELLDRAFEAVGRGERIIADTLAGQVLALDRGNPDAEDLLAAPVDQGEIRRLTILFADLVDSTALSTRIEPETYRTVVGRYKERVRQVVDRYEGHVASIKGDGLLVVFGHPRAHEDDARRALHAGLDIAREVAVLSERVQQRFGFTIEVRVGIHRGVVYLDLEQDDVYGLAANLAARMSGLAPPGGVVVSAAVERLTRKHFELRHLKAQPVKGIAGPVDHYQVLGERVGETPISDRPVVGRERELTQIEESWGKARAGVLDVAGLSFCGEAGIGKSRLAATAVELAEQSQAVVIELTGSPLHTDVGLHPVRRLLERRCGIDRATSPAECVALLETELARRGLDPAEITPLLAPVLAISPQAGYQAADVDGPKLYRRIGCAVRDYLRACMGDGPALVVAEDMHWFDEDTTEVVQSLLDGDAADSGRLLVVMTSREAASLPNSENIAHFALAPLTEQETDQLIVALYPELGADARRAVSARCDGLPLFIEEVVAKLKEQPADAAESTHVPDSLYEALFARLRSHHAVRVLEGAAVVGNPVDRRLLAAAVQIGESELDAAIRELRDGRVLEPVGQATWRFRHELLRDIATELSPPTRRREMHGRVADALLSSTAEANTDWPLIASHYELAERYESAASAYRKASGAARRRGALNEARSYLSHAISQIERLPAGPARDRLEISLRQRRGLLFYAAEGALSRNAAGDFERCLTLHGTELSEDLLSTMSALYGHYAVRADLRRVEQLLQAIEAVVVKGRPEAWPTLTAGFGMLAWYRGEFDRARERLETAASQRHHVGQDVMASWFMANEPIASIHTHLAMARYIQGDLSGAADELLASARRCDEVGPPQGPFSLAYTRQMEALIRIESGELDRAVSVTASLVSDASKHGFDSYAVLGVAVQAIVAAQLALTNGPNDPDALGTHIATVTGLVDGWRAIGLKALITFYDAVLARLLLAAGRPADARERIDVSLRLAADTGMRFYDAELLRIRAHTHDVAHQRREGLRAAVELARRQHATIFELRAAADDFELHGEPARRQLQDSVLRMPDNGGWPELSRARALLG